MSDRKQVKSSSMKRPRRSSTRKTSKKQPKRRVIAQPGRSSSQRRSIAIASDRVVRNPTMVMEGEVIDKVHGRGQFFVGNQMLTSVTTTASDSQLWTGTTPATVSSINTIGLSPDLFNSRIAVLASTYLKYRFVDVEIDYDSLVASTQAGGAAICVNNDVTSSVTSYSAVQEVTPSVRFAFRDEHVSLKYHHSGDELWVNKYDSTNIATIRQTTQGMIIGFPSASSIGASTMGTLSIRYRVEFFYPTSNQSLAQFVRCTDDEYAMLAKALATYRLAVATKSLEAVPLSRVPTLSQSTSSATSASSGSTNSGWFRV